MKLFLVDCVSSHRTSYVVRCNSAEHAADAVIMNEAAEFSQSHLGENISRVTEITKKQYMELFDKDNDYLKTWDEDQKLNFIHTVEYEEAGKYDPLINYGIDL